MTREEAIRRIKAWNLDSDDMEVLAVVIPELCESEDERIRKGLIKLLTVASEAYLVESTGIKKDSYLAWLEKQKERKPAEWSEEDTEMYINVASSLRGYACGLENEEHKKHIKKGLDWLENRFESLRSQSHWKPSEVCYGPTGDPDPAGVWKPSEEQMEALERASTNEYLSAKQFDILVSLYEQLKKL